MVQGDLEATFHPRDDRSIAVLLTRVSSEDRQGFWGHLSRMAPVDQAVGRTPALRKLGYQPLCLPGGLRTEDASDPPPPLKRWSARLLHRAQAPDQRFRVRAEVEGRGLSGLFLGTYSASAPSTLCRVVRRVRPLGWCFAVDRPGGGATAWSMPCAAPCSCPAQPGGTV